MKRLIISAVVSATTVMAAVAAHATPPIGPFAQHGHGPGPGGGPMGFGPGKMLPILLKSADLTPEQRERVRTIIDAQRDDFKTRFGELRDAHEAMRDRLFGPGQITRGDLEPQVARVRELRAQLAEAALKVVLEVRALLTAEQLAKVEQANERLQALRSEMQELLGEPGGPGAQ